MEESPAVVDAVEGVDFKKSFDQGSIALDNVPSLEENPAPDDNDDESEDEVFSQEGSSSGSGGVSMEGGSGMKMKIIHHLLW